MDISNWDAANRNLVSKFNWDGKLFADFTFKGIELFDFDKCNRLLSNKRTITSFLNDSFIFGSGCFSPDNNLMYANNLNYIYQINLDNLSFKTIGAYDKFEVRR